MVKTNANSVRTTTVKETWSSFALSYLLLWLCFESSLPCQISYMESLKQGEHATWKAGSFEASTPQSINERQKRR